MIASGIKFDPNLSLGNEPRRGQKWSSAVTTRSMTLVTRWRFDQYVIHLCWHWRALIYLPVPRWTFLIATCMARYPESCLSIPSMAPYLAPTKKLPSSYVAPNVYVRNEIWVLHIDLIKSRQQNSNILSVHLFNFWKESEQSVSSAKHLLLALLQEHQYPRSSEWCDPWSQKATVAPIFM